MNRKISYPILQGQPEPSEAPSVEAPPAVTKGLSSPRQQHHQRPRATPPTTPRSDSLPMTQLSPRSHSLKASSHHRSPRLGQDTFDNETRRLGTPARSPGNTGAGHTAELSKGGLAAQPVHYRKLSYDDSVHPIPEETADHTLPISTTRTLEWDHSWLSPTAKSPISRPEKAWQSFDDTSRAKIMPGTYMPTLAPAAELQSRTSLEEEKQPSGSSDDGSDSSETARKKPDAKPSVMLLFALTSRSDRFTIVLPATILSVLAGLVAPYMTEVIGKAFGTYSNYALAVMHQPPLSADQLAAARHTMLSQSRTSAITFAGIGVAIFFLQVSSTWMWTIHGERVVRALRKEVYEGVNKRSIGWFDMGMGVDTSADSDEEEVEDGDEETGAGSGGLVGRFTRETDDVRMATSATCGLVVQYLTSFFVALGISFYRSYMLTFAVLGCFPIIAFVVSSTESRAHSLVLEDREYSTKSASRLDRILGAIPTVKAFNAEEREVKSFSALTNIAFNVYNRLHFIWGLRGGIVQFIIMAMFVQGFWFGWWLVSHGKASAQSISTCFWACLVASSYVQSCVPLLVTIEKGKVAMAGELNLARQTEITSGPDANRNSAVVKDPRSSKETSRGGRSKSKHFRGASKDSSVPLRDSKTSSIALSELRRESSSPPLVSVPMSTSAPVFIPVNGAMSKKHRGQSAPRALRKVQPSIFTGELSLRGVTFHYPSRPHPAPPVLQDVSLYLAARETTFIVGGSGSGKSTVASLLMGLYTPESGRVEVDEQGLEWIDDEWLRSHVACVSQGAAIIFEGTVHENVAMGVVGQVREDGTRRKIEDVTREEVTTACRGALLHDFVRDLPEGYDTWLSGEKGAALSGGQRQRLAIARAWIRNPTVLILDEATSALDATSRLLVSEAVKASRKNRTTIIITHDLSAIEENDFVYVMADGQVVEQGYRRDLEAVDYGPFNQLAQQQQQLPRLELGEEETQMNDTDVLEELSAEFLGTQSATRSSYWPQSKHNSRRASSNWGFPGTGLMGGGSGVCNVARASRDLQKARRASMGYKTTSSSLAVPTEPLPRRHPSSGQGSVSSRDHTSSKMELGSTCSSPFRLDESMGRRRDSSLSFVVLEQLASAAVARRPVINRVKHDSYIEGSELSTTPHVSEKGAIGDVVVEMTSDRAPRKVMSLFRIAREFYPTLPNKMALFLGLFLSIVVGVSTPVFSFLLAKLIANLANPHAGKVVTRTSLLVLLVAAIDGLADFFKFYILERCAMGWITSLRCRGLALVLRQDKSFFDRPENTTGALVHSLVKDAEDARLLVGTVISQVLVCATMLLLGVFWAMATGWELTLVGVGFAPIFLFLTRGLQVLHAKHEARNKVLRENVARRFHLNVSNIKALRSMSLESVVLAKFEHTLRETYAGAMRAAPLAGMGNGVTLGLTFVAEAVMVYVGALLIANGRYDFEKMATIFSLIIFSMTYAAQIAIYMPAITKSQEAIIDLSRLLELDTNTSESEGSMVFPVQGAISFNKVDFSYPSRADVPILREISFSIKAGECVGIVGSSGSGKSTVTALLQRLYEPSNGSVLLDGRPLSRVDVKFLRNHVAVVSQHPVLFDLSIADNISYGCNLSEPRHALQAKIERAAQLAHVHDFIKTLPRGYETKLGENASLISGGQLQRLQLARALMQDREILLLDECTSALDATNQALVMQTIEEVKKGRTTIIVTHKLDVMRRCDRLIVIHEGRVVETGTVDDLRARGGHFAQLASGGEWEAS
ncbi:BZ3500_MvSof-1268-A1-R1_Chr10-1g02629 [Microbotryum saponariae]|uniref:BZ3500_MvSof-1268-A1-R1_Chr10-1g02629 protein n=1 Tax=Microbotryum saponariae TaxID=289078 RepID=A0A2X0LLR2_9BASI|nr:BZ3500_MvSof-1268-A1-R1_Chr10-1g02629 [Microbotryum saponariae]SDA06118.1 BZ3501_MvSof-1269-A2-R1_Chr10-1g02230 [Microbotryum saponariae]